MSDTITSVVWTFRTHDGFLLTSPVLQFLLVACVFFWDYLLLLPYTLLTRAWSAGRWPARDPQRKALGVLVVIPTLLRKRGELESLKSTVRSVAGNGYPGELVIVLAIDGTRDAPPLYAELRTWVRARAKEFSCRLLVTGTAQRRGKPMAIDHGVNLVEMLVKGGVIDAFPPVYVSTDADADLGPGALEALVRRLERRNPSTGWPARVVAGGLHVRGNAYFQGLRRFFTVEGQLNLQVAREYYVSNIGRQNIRWLPLCGVPGALYCTWSEIFLTVPKFMGYVKTLDSGAFFGWWLGRRVPLFSTSDAAPLPELMAGDTDDTVTAYVASIARYKDGHFVFDPPRTPLHALLDLLRGLLFDRPIQYAPRARVFTSSPTTIRALFRQRKRWNTSRIELTGRFLPVLRYHWVIWFPSFVVLGFMLKSLVLGGLSYFVVPVLLWTSSWPSLFVLGYLCSLLVISLFTLTALIINGDLREHSGLLFALPLAPFYGFLFNWAGQGLLVLMHDTHSATRDALTEIISGLKAAGYRFATLEELVQHAFGQPSWAMTLGEPVDDHCDPAQACNVIEADDGSELEVCGRLARAYEEAGGEEVLGKPLTNAASDGRLSQVFEHGRLELHPEAQAPCDATLTHSTL